MAWLGIFADEAGVLLVMACKKAVILGNAKIHMGAVLKCQGSGEVVNAFNSLESLHSKRLRQWKTPEDLRPPARPKDNSAAAWCEWMAQGGVLDNVPLMWEWGSHAPVLDWNAAAASIATPFNMLQDQQAEQLP